ncbi:LysR family transcriptional regulator [Glacieibacterium megasporae]|uniref:LysR family transcriptional regulator n=1 Tax=Glacieibacterium megasporae TaxID=2835787 RepID=UPI001C1E77FC|nr:LysR family transcriptional regulator [Polymorphobacter megasporae]UAJ11106.1 LysR family transcriptional regulator [Polymorphobacter megasporae]
MAGRIEEMEAFAAVASAGGFSAAARRLGTSTSRLSRTIGDLEGRLGARLFHRTTRALALTEAGSAYLDATTRLIEDVRAAEESVASSTLTLSGVIRMAAPMLFGVERVGPALFRFMELHPGVRIELILDDRITDLIGEGIDIAVRIGTQLPDSGLIARSLGTVEMYLVGAPVLLDRLGRPGVPEDLIAFPSLTSTITRADEPWRFPAAGGTRLCRGPERLRSRSGEILCAAAIAGLGLTILPDFFVRAALADGRLEQLLPAHRFEAGTLRLIYPTTRSQPVKVRALADFLAAEFGTANSGVGKDLALAEAAA